MTHKEKSDKESVLSITDDVGEMLTIPEDCVIVSGMCNPVKVDIFCKNVKANDGIATDSELTDKDKIFLLKQTNRHGMGWDIDRAKCKDGFIQILMKNPKNTLDRFWVLSNVHPCTLDTVFTIFDNTETVVSLNEKYLEDDGNQSGKDTSKVQETTRSEETFSETGSHLDNSDISNIWSEDSYKIKEECKIKEGEVENI